jgi:hypothetical protein
MSNRNNKYYKTLLFLLSFCIIHSTLCIATVRYVSKTGNSTPPYITWETAADSIQECINICVFGDTIYVANGVYREQVVMIDGLSLIGSGTDSCIVDSRNFPLSNNKTITMQDSCLVTGFYIRSSTNFTYGYGISAIGQTGLITKNKFSEANIGIELRNSNIIVYKNYFFNIRGGVYVWNSNSIVRKNEIYILTDQAGTGIGIAALNDNYSPSVDSNIIMTIGDGIVKSLGSRPRIINNSISLRGGEGIQLSYSDSVYIFNNRIFVKSGGEGIYQYGPTYLQLFNNYFTGNLGDAITILPDNSVKNNVVTNANKGVVFMGSGNFVFQYNNIWNNNINCSGFIPDSTNLSVDPMIVNDDTTQGELDFHLQMYSPLIDAGDPNILDRDGSRSDIGLYGGPYGESYFYQDLAPKKPKGLFAYVEDSTITLAWNKNTEADFSHYRIYRDTLTIVIYDSSKMIGETPDTFYYDQLPPVNHETRFYYVITAFDNQGNQSYPSEEINVLVTGLGEYPPIGYDGYGLLSNYPNPFNPSTVIPYRLKEGGYVKLYVYDVKGELVRVLVNEWQEKGYYEVMFHPNSEEKSRAKSFEVPMEKTYSDIATGVYLYMIHVYNDNRIPVFSDSGKMILLK